MKFRGSPTFSAAIDITGGTPKFVAPLSKAVKATGTLTLTDAPADGDTFLITGAHGLRTYTARTAPNNAVADEVLRGASATAFVANLTAAIMGWPGSYSTATYPNQDVTASAAAGVLTATAILGGTAGNAIETTEVCSVASWGAGTLTGGAQPAIILPDRAVSGFILNPNPESITVGIATPPTKVLYMSPGATPILGHPILLSTPLEFEWDADSVPAFYLHCAQTATFYIEYV